MTFLQELETVLKDDERFVSEDNQLLKPRVQDSVTQLDPQLIRRLLASPLLKEHFFKDVDGVTIFDQEKFMWVVSSKEFLPDSYTSYRNKIGLSANDHDLLTSSNEVSLVWPYKDCVLEGGQDKEDEKRDEVFYNETLAPDEVGRLLAPKAFTNATRYTEQGEERVTEFDENENLIIKGNNLLALSSLLERYEGQVKCIYIDPPYYFNAARAEDTFAYNSRFKKSTWLTFMKNRLQIARRLLAPEGAIFVQISDDGVAELHLLLKEVFGEENFLNKITVRTKSPSGFASINAGVFETAEYIIAFGRDKRRWRYNTQYVATKWDENYKWYVTNKSEAPDEWTIVSIYDYLASQNGFATIAKMRGQLGKAAVEEMAAEFALEHKDSVFRYTAISDKAGAQVVAAREASRQRGERIIAVERESQYTVYVHNGQELAFYSKKVREIDNELVPSMQVTNIWSDTPYEGIAAEGGVTLKGGKKPEKLLQRIIALNTDPGDLVLDYHLGSGTTAAVAHKMG
ncbi:MAG: site-specific DNA-methyltransferase, partial [Bifidobacteriales bacterium]|nr:site-specific DNA-methyltransferase [Bifidobacteriales bacterium]